MEDIQSPMRLVSNKDNNQFVKKNSEMLLLYYSLGYLSCKKKVTEVTQHQMNSVHL